MVQRSCKKGPQLGPPNGDGHLPLGQPRIEIPGWRSTHGSYFRACFFLLLLLRPFFFNSFKQSQKVETKLVGTIHTFIHFLNSCRTKKNFEYKIYWFKNISFNYPKCSKKHLSISKYFQKFFIKRLNEHTFRYLAIYSYSSKVSARKNTLF